MRTMLISFKPDVYLKLVSGEKIYEHRKVFPDEPVKAYIYVSSPVKAISGIIYLNNRTSLQQWKQKYRYDPECVKRIDNYLLRYNYAMEINKFERTNSISLGQLKKDLDRFIVPQMYYYIENTELLAYLEEKLEADGLIIEHKYDNIKSSMICKS